MTKNGHRSSVRQAQYSQDTPGHEVHPYLPRGVTINHTNQIWALDTTCIRLIKGFAVLTMLVDA
ncbi:MULTISPECIES: hypothetical protein [Methylomonas]|uniref:Uncharacterized protein n=1 Tax=Methylomonas koyamae TaxID=702114 RepID=A0A177PAH2_9GAMM|nr:hypothetical protein [Methylomonas koyamae]OAI27337.1 hypothetical protein A1355_18285 [Methylomonas koyamae]